STKIKFSSKLFDLLLFSKIFTKKILLSYVRMRERMKDASGQEKRAYGKLRRPSLLFWRL
ncbi:hypothetical protein, partial [Blautia wexlerae]|uniref:hypothetical protein n=1 Tax=Blautia wexlerae TaxID=418240 RepID=UPI001A9BBD77